jgi:uncharacterized BrkB/YihY/UPF0761 family membrane protein
MNKYLIRGFYFILIILLTPWVFGWVFGFFGFVLVLLNDLFKNPCDDNKILLVTYIVTIFFFLIILSLIFALRRPRNRKGTDR